LAARTGRIRTTSYLPDLNVWLALSWANHMHSDAAWTWFSRQNDNRFFFCPFTQVGLLRLLATAAVMGKDVRTIGEAWKAYDRWLEIRESECGRTRLNLIPPSVRQPDRFPGCRRRKRLAITICSRSARSRLLLS